MSYSRQPRIINDLANNDNISGEIALSLAANRALSWHNASNLSSHEDWGNDFYSAHKAFRESRIAEENERLSSLEAEGDKEKIHSQKRYTDYVVEELNHFEKRTIWFREQKEKKNQA